MESRLDILKRKEAVLYLGRLQKLKWKIGGFIWQLECGRSLPVRSVWEPKGALQTHVLNTHITHNFPRDGNSFWRYQAIVFSRSLMRTLHCAFARSIFSLLQSFCVTFSLSCLSFSFSLFLFLSLSLPRSLACSLSLSILLSCSHTRSLARSRSLLFSLPPHALSPLRFLSLARTRASSLSFPVCLSLALPLRVLVCARFLSLSLPPPPFLALLPSLSTPLWLFLSLKLARKKYCLLNLPPFLFPFNLQLCCSRRKLHDTSQS